MASKRVINKRLTLVSEDVRGLKAAIVDNNWGQAMDWLNDATGDIEVVREYIQERLDKEDDHV
jgi:hypothetical protein